MPLPLVRFTVRRRLIASFFMALVLFLAWYCASFILPAPRRALYNLGANPGGILFMAAILFALYGTPLWAALFLLVTYAGRRQATADQGGQSRIPVAPDPPEPE